MTNGKSTTTTTSQPTVYEDEPTNIQFMRHHFVLMSMFFERTNICEFWHKFLLNKPIEILKKHYIFGSISTINDIDNVSLSCLMFDGT